MAPKAERTPSGAYRVRFRYGPSKKDPSIKRMTSETFTGPGAKKRAEDFASRVSATSPQEAIDWLYASEASDEIPTLNQLAEDHIEHLTGIEEGTRLTYRRLWARTWGPLIGGVQASRVDQDDIRRAVNKLATSYASKSLENQRGLLFGVLGRAIEKGYLPRNPAKGIKLPRGNEGDAVEMRIITQEEYADIEKRMDAHFRPLLRFLTGTGARWGEAVALTVADLDLANGNVRIRRALKWSPDNKRKVGATKTKRSNRTVALPPELLPELRALCNGRKGGDLVFQAKRGGAVLHRTFWSRYWLPAVEHLEPRPRIHDLRHSHASWLLARGVPIHIVSARLGHESIQTTVDTYGHLLPDAQMIAASAAAAVFAPAPKALKS